MLVHEVMSTGLMTAYKTDTVRSAVMKMIHRRCGSIPIVEGDNQLVGIVTLRDVLLPLYPHHGDSIIPDMCVVVNLVAHDDVHSRNFVEMEEGYPEALGGKVGGIMSRNPLTVAPHDPILEAASYMAQELPAHPRRRQGRARRDSEHRRHQPRVVLRARHAALSQDSFEVLLHVSSLFSQCGDSTEHAV